MTGDPGKMSCAEFQAQLPELIASGEDATTHPHLQSCQDCRAFLAVSKPSPRRPASYFPAWNRRTKCGSTSSQPSDVKQKGASIPDCSATQSGPVSRRKCL